MRIAEYAFSALRSNARFCLLSSLLFLAALPGCKGDGLSDYQREKNKKEDALSALRAQGAKVESKNYRGHGNAYVVNLSGATLTPDTFANLKALQSLQPVAELDLSKSSLTDEQMDQLNEVAFLLTNLDLSNTAVTDAGLEKLTNLNLCFNLNLAGTKVTPEGAERFKQQRLARPTTRIKDMKIQMR